MCLVNQVGCAVVRSGRVRYGRMRNQKPNGKEVIQMARVRYAFLIRGTRPYLHHGVGAGTLSLEKKPKDRGVAGNNPDEWRDSVRVNKETRELFVTSQELWASWREGGRRIKKGRSSIKWDIIATLLIEGPEEIPVGLYLPKNWEEEQLITDKSQEVYLDVRPVKNPSTRALNIRYRVAMKSGWEVSAIASFDNTVLEPTQMHSALIDAGALAGIGDGRNIGMGRFELVSFEEVK